MEWVKDQYAVGEELVFGKIKGLILLSISLFIFLFFLLVSILCFYFIFFNFWELI